MIVPESKQKTMPSSDNSSPPGRNKPAHRPARQPVQPPEAAPGSARTAAHTPARAAAPPMRGRSAPPAGAPVPAAGEMHERASPRAGADAAPPARAARAQPAAAARNPLLPITFPEDLPVSGRREDIAQALQKHQVVIICGETGSGKTTQLPKICLQLGRGQQAMIGHTQPRRIAASSTAKRIAQELGTPLGHNVGYKVRFTDTLDKGASVKLMTDGILLAETQTDPLLKQYDTIIIDEAHERSLNIDFLLGYLKQILPKRRDLKLIITSATIDADRFARHFASHGQNAPIIEVSGRLYAVEVRYRPIEADLPPSDALLNRAQEMKQAAREKRDLMDGVTDAVDELARHGSGDILVFLPGEREIRDCAESLRKHHPPHVEILPLFARLSAQEQERVFKTGNARRIVLATNVAETSLTVPGIRYVVDAGTARVKRYSYRNKVDQLQIEAISQAAANQRAGRCGRVADGICIRLYDEQDFIQRPKFTEPEILRSSLAAVILRMKALRLTDVESFPFVEAPQGRAIADGYQLLQELGAIDDSNQLTELGRKLAKLPLDPRVGRMILASLDNVCLKEVLIIAAALSVQDPRDRPLEAQQAADEAHKKFADPKSEFVSYLKIWDWFEAAIEHKKSNRQLQDSCRSNFLSALRLREWRDVHSQLLTIVREQGWRLNDTPATYDNLHLALLTGLLGNIGFQAEGEPHYLGARSIKFHIWPGSHLQKKAGKWIMCAELVDTTRLYARCIAQISPEWIEKVAGHLLKKSWGDPHWEKNAAQVSASERATLYGLVIYSQRRIHYGPLNPVQARELLIRDGLVGGEFETRAPFFAFNRQLVREIENLEHKSRRLDVLVDEQLIAAFYDKLLPPDIINGASFEAWHKQATAKNPKLLYLNRDELMRHEAAGVTTDLFPKKMLWAGIEMVLTYHFEPGSVRDGVTLAVPLYGLNQLSSARCEWLVPGMLKEKVHLLLKSLPQKLRRHCVPLPDYAAKFCERVAGSFGAGELLDVLIADIREQTTQLVKLSDFKQETLPAHHSMNFKVVDENGRQLDMGRNLAALQAELGKEARASFQKLAGEAVAGSGAAGQLGAAAALTGAGTLAGAPGSTGAGASTGGARVAAAAQAGGLGAAGQTGAAGQGAAGQVGVRKGASQSPAAAAAGAAGGSAPSGQSPAPANQALTTWSFGELPELLEIEQGKMSLIGFPALVDKQSHCELTVFDDPALAQRTHRQGLRRLFALQMKDQLKYLEKNIPGLQNLGMQFMTLGSQEELREQILNKALDLACLQDPLPQNEAAFTKRKEEGKARLGLLGNEIARLLAQILPEFHALPKKLQTVKAHAAACADMQSQVQGLINKQFLSNNEFAQLAHFPRYLKALTVRIDKLRADPARDAKLMAEWQQAANPWQKAARGHTSLQDPKMQEFRWMLEELRVSLFAQELRTPMPISLKRLQKVWESMQR
jgi:ATP-dependent helicase HrpA